MTRVFLDANILFSAARIRRGENRPRPSKSRLVFSAARRRPDITLLVSKFAVGEAFKNLAEDRAVSLHSLSELGFLMRETTMVSHIPPWLMLQLTSYIPTSADDVAILAGAVHGEADWLVTGNRKDFGHLYDQEVRGVRVLRLATALGLIRPPV